MWSTPSNHNFVAFASNFVEPHVIPNDEEEEEGTAESTRHSRRLGAQRRLTDDIRNSEGATSPD